MQTFSEEAEKSAQHYKMLIANIFKVIG